MDDESRVLLDLLRTDGRLAWVRDQLVASFAEGITQSAKDRSGVMQVNFGLAEADVTPRERTKREKYETSRPYESEEKAALIRHALHEVFVTVPEIQIAAMRSIADFGSAATSIEFLVPDDEERSDGSQTHYLMMDPAIAEDLRHRFKSFEEWLRS